MKTLDKKCGLKKKCSINFIQLKMSDSEIYEIEEIKELEYIKHSSTDSSWLQKKWSLNYFTH